MNLNHPDLPRKSSHTWLKLEDGEIAPVSLQEMETLVRSNPGAWSFEGIQGRKIFKIGPGARATHATNSFLVFIQLFEGEEARDDLSLMELF